MCFKKTNGQEGKGRNGLNISRIFAQCFNICLIYLVFRSLPAKNLQRLLLKIIPGAVLGKNCKFVEVKWCQ